MHKICSDLGTCADACMYVLTLLYLKYCYYEVQRCYTACYVDDYVLVSKQCVHVHNIAN